MGWLRLVRWFFVNDAIHAPEQDGNLRLVVRLQAGAVDNGLPLGDDDRGFGMGELVVGHGIKNAGGDLGTRAAVEAFPDDMNIAVELDVLAVLVQPGEVGFTARRGACRSAAAERRCCRRRDNAASFAQQACCSLPSTSKRRTWKLSTM
jgi:hypothetical protein